MRFEADSHEHVRDDERTFGQLLREFRVRAGYSQDSLAERARLSAKAISAIECGNRRAPYRHTVELLIDALNLAPNERHELEHAANRVRGRGTIGRIAGYEETRTIRVGQALVSRFMVTVNEATFCIEISSVLNNSITVVDEFTPQPELMS
jgi:transcriptional regulator with XRE-family HTH domain